MKQTKRQYPLEKICHDLLTAQFIQYEKTQGSGESKEVKLREAQREKQGGANKQIGLVLLTVPYSTFKILCVLTTIRQKETVNLHSFLNPK